VLFRSVVRIQKYLVPDVVAEFAPERPLFGVCARAGGDRVAAAASSARYGAPGNVFAAERPVFFATGDEPGAWVEAAFCNRQIYLSGIVIKSSPFEKDDVHPRAFKIEGTGNRGDTVVVAQVDECHELNAPSAVLFLKVEQQTPFHTIRISQTGPNWKGTHELAICSVDFYGRLEEMATWAAREQKREEVANQQKIKALEEELAWETQTAKLRREASIRRISERHTRRSKMRAKCSRFRELLFFEFCQCFELPLRETLPGLCETDVEWTLFTMFENLPGWMTPAADRPPPEPTLV
jgi:hypothetical protein